MPLYKANANAPSWSRVVRVAPTRYAQPVCVRLRIDQGATGKDLSMSVGDGRSIVIARKPDCWKDLASILDSDANELIEAIRAGVRALNEGIDKP